MISAISAARIPYQANGIKTNKQKDVSFTSLNLGKIPSKIARVFKDPENIDALIAGPGLASFLIGAIWMFEKEANYINVPMALGGIAVFLFGCLHRKI